MKPLSQQELRPGESGHHEMVDKGPYLGLSAPLFRDNYNFCVLSFVSGKLTDIVPIQAGTLVGFA